MLVLIFAWVTFKIALIFKPYLPYYVFKKLSVPSITTSSRLDPIVIDDGDDLHAHKRARNFDTGSSSKPQISIKEEMGETMDYHHQFKIT